jgi:hypothetical protein
MNFLIKKFNIDMLKDRCEIDSRKSTMILVIGKKDTGKSFLVRDILFNTQHCFPIGTVISGTEVANEFFQHMVPSKFIHDKYSPDIVTNVIKRQMVMKQKRNTAKTGSGGQSSIDPRAFSGATNLKQVTFLPGSNISLIGESAFADTNLKLVVMGKPALDKLNTTAVPKLRFGDGNTFYGANNVSITSMADQAYSFLNVARQPGSAQLPPDAARLAASFVTGLTPKRPKGGRKRATRKGGRKAAVSKKKASRRRKTSRLKVR